MIYFQFIRFNLDAFVLYFVDSHVASTFTLKHTSKILLTLAKPIGFVF